METRTLEERLRMLDEIVGRCVRDPSFAAAVMADPDAALVAYDDDDVIGDLRVLAQDPEKTLAGWAAVRAVMTRG